MIFSMLSLDSSFTLNTSHVYDISSPSMSLIESILNFIWLNGSNVLFVLLEDIEIVGLLFITFITLELLVLVEPFVSVA